VPGGKCFLNEGEKTTGGSARNDIEGHHVVFLASATQAWNDLVGLQQETQTACPLNELFFLAGKRRRPKWASTCRLNSSEVIECCPDKIRVICSAVTSGRTGLGVVVFTAHDVKLAAEGGQVSI
jgi:hypothetical protein